MKGLEFFKGKKVVIATNHRKEEAIAPVLEQLGCEIILPSNLNTDHFGTFAGDVERKLSVHETAKMKIAAAIAETGADAGLANEGTFGAHPFMPFVQADTEYMLYYDPASGIEKGMTTVSSEMQAHIMEVHSIEDLKQFRKEDFDLPAHGVIVKGYDVTVSGYRIIKGLQRAEDVIHYAETMLNKGLNSVSIENDLRAFMNPTRMKVIRQNAEELVQKLLNFCAVCEFPGFEGKENIRGLKCASCRFPTRLIQEHIYRCDRCNHEKRMRASSEYADPMYCDFCNP